MILIQLVLAASVLAPILGTEDPPTPVPVAKLERVLVAGTRVNLLPPRGFVPAVGFTGFQLPGLRVSILVTEMPGSSVEVAKGMDENGLRRGGMKLLAREDATISGRKGVLLHVAQTQQGVEFEKWMAVFGDEKHTVMVVGVFPRTIAAEHSDSLKRVVLDADWDPTRVVDPFADLDWELDVVRDLPFAGRMQKMLVFNVEGAIPAKDPSQAMLVVGPSVDDARVDDLRKYAESRVRQTALMKQIEIRRSGGLKVAGFEGWEIVAIGEHEKTKTAMHLYQLMVLRPEGYILAQGRCTEGDAKRFAPLFEKSARSWKPKPEPATDTRAPPPK